MADTSLGVEGETPPQSFRTVPVAAPPADYVQTGDKAFVKDDGTTLAPILWTNKTCSDWAPISVHHIRLSLRRQKQENIPLLSAQAERPGKFILVGSSPYVTRYVEEIRDLAASPDSVVFAINSAHNFVLDHNIRLDGSVLFEGGPDNHVRKFKSDPAVTYYIASWCHPHQWGKLRDNKRVMWHGWSEVKAQIEAYQEFPCVVTQNSAIYSAKDGAEVPGLIEDRGIIGGGSTTFSRTVNIGFVLGYREFELFGFDSSFEKDGESHYVMSAIGQGLPTIDITPRVGWKDEAKTVPNLGPVFHCKPFMARQAHEFMNMLGSQTPGASPNPWLTIPNRVRMHGPGLLPWMHRTRWPQYYEGVKANEANK